MDSVPRGYYIPVIRLQQNVATTDLGWSELFVTLQEGHSANPDLEPIQSNSKRYLYNLSHTAGQRLPSFSQQGEMFISIGGFVHPPRCKSEDAGGKGPVRCER